MIDIYKRRGVIPMTTTYKLRVTRDKSKNLVDSVIDLSANGADVGVTMIQNNQINLVCVLGGGGKGEDLYLLLPKAQLSRVEESRYVVLYPPEQVQAIYKQAVRAQKNRQKSAFLDIFYLQVNQRADKASQALNRRVLQNT